MTRNVCPIQDLIKTAVASWNNGDVAALVSMFAEDVAYCSPFISDGEEASRWVQGSQAVSEHLLILRNQFDKLELVEVLAGAGFTNLLLRHEHGHIAMLIEPDENRLARRIIVCHSKAVLIQAAAGSARN